MVYCMAGSLSIVCVCVVCVCVYVQVDQFESEVESIHSSTKKKKLDRDVRRMR